MYWNFKGAIPYSPAFYKMFEIAHNWMKLLQIAKVWFDWWTSTNVSNLSKRFYFHSIFEWSFLICQDLIEAVGPYQNVPNLLKCF